MDGKVSDIVSATAKLTVKAAADCRFDSVSLGEVMLRLDPGEGRVHTTRTFQAWEGGGEYNVSRGLRRCFGLRTAHVTALADNPVGRLVEDLMLQGGVDLSYLRWKEYDGVGRSVRNGLNFTERGFGPRGGVGCSDRGHTAVSQLQPADVDWKHLFGGAGQGARWFHTGGVFCALSETTPGVAHAAMEEAHKHGTCVSYDLNYRDSLWRSVGGKAQARKVNRSLMPFIDVLFGNEEDFSAALGFDLQNVDPHFQMLPTAAFRSMIAEVVAAFPNIKTVATTLRTSRSASVNGWGAICWHEGQFYEVAQRDVEILDRVGGGDSFASGLIYGLLAGKDPQWALECGVAHGALAMSTPGDTTMATFAEVMRAMKGSGTRIDR
jgi:2-dehydro-3-deoxygluconokinase